MGISFNINNNNDDDDNNVEVEHKDDYDKHYRYEIVIITKITILLNVVERILIIVLIKYV